MPDAVSGVPMWLLKATALAVGAVFGSFANVLVHRIPRGESIMRPGSHCPSCGAAVRWFDNVPVLSWVVLLGRCRSCKAAISLRYPLLELCGAVLSLACLLWAVARSPAGVGVPGVVATWTFPFAFCLILLVVTFVDMEHWRIPPSLTVTGAILGVGGAVALGPVYGVTWLDSLIGLAVGGLGLAALTEAWYLVTKREGLGYGDVFLLGMIGATLGWKALPFVLLAASVQGLAITLPMLIAGRHSAPPWDQTPQSPAADPGAGDATAPPQRPALQTPVPFGPFLALGALEWMFFSDVLLSILFP